ncbi:MAG: hypothetical protein U0324_32145 [Polyangiales bacterium]
MREHAADVAPYAERVERAKADRQLAAREQEDAAAAAVAASIGPDLAAWLPAFLALPPAARELVRRGDAARPWRASLAACEALTAGGDVAVGRAAAAATALQRAAELAARDPDEAARLLAGHERVLDRAPETQRAMQQVLDARRARAVARAEEAVGRAEAARAAGRWEEALAALDEVAGVEALPAALRARAEGARGALTKALAYERERGVLPPAEALPEAARALTAIGAAAHAPWALGAAARWSAARESLRALAAARWPVAVVPNDEGAPTTPCTLPLPTGPIAPAQPGSRWVFAMSVDRLVTLCEYDLARNVAATRVALPAGVELGDVAVDVGEETVTLRDAWGADLALDRRTWAVRDVARDGVAPREGYAPHARVTWPGCPWRWAVSGNGTHFACDRMDGARSLVCATEPVPVRGHGPPRMFVRSGERDWALLDAAGDAVMRWRAPAALLVVAAAPAPGGDGWILVARDAEVTNPAHFDFTVHHLRAGGRGLSSVARFRARGTTASAFADAGGGCWVAAAASAMPTRFLSLRAEADGRVVEAWRCVAPAEAVAVPVDGGARVLLAVPREGAFAVEPLRADRAPDLGEPDEAADDAGDAPGARPEQVPEEAKAFLDFLRAARVDRSELPKLAVPGAVGEMIARCQGSVVALLALATVYLQCALQVPFGRVIERLDAVTPGDARAALLRARWASAYASPEDALAACAEVPPEGLSDRDLVALLTARMKAHVERGEDEAAAALLPALKKVATELEYLLMEDACAPLPEPLALEAVLAEPATLVQRRSLIELADRALAAGDPRAALRAIVTSGVYRSGDRHANGRACRAIFALDDPTPAERVDGLAFVARYASAELMEVGGLGCQRFRHPSRHLPGGEVEQLRADAKRFLSLLTAPFGA